MDYCRFLAALFADGRVAVPAVGPLGAEVVSRADQLLEHWERQYRLELPAGVPEFAVTAARWAATRFYRACQFAVYREVPAAVLEKELDDLPCPVASSEAHYSVDVVFRYLPDLTRFARSAAGADPLVEHLRRWAQKWPLSSVGMRGVEGVSIDGFADSPGLMRLYADRVIATGDTSRLNDPRACQAVSTALGMHEALCGRVAAALGSCQSKETTE
jgi:hypothetical protein